MPGRPSIRRGQVIPVLRYRSLDPHTSRGARRRPMPLATFARHCRLITASGRVPMTVSGHVATVGTASAPGNPVIITIDDGGAETMSALRQLAESGLTATVFVTSSRVGDPGYFHRTDLHRIRGLGIEIGGSGHTGRPLNELARPDVIAELTLSRRRLAVAVGDEPRTFAYPGGGYDLSVRQLVISAGYSSACAVRDVLSHPDDDRFALARLTVEATTPDSRLVAWLDGLGQPGPHPVLARGRVFRPRRTSREAGPFRPRLGGGDSDSADIAPAAVPAADGSDLSYAAAPRAVGDSGTASLGGLVRSTMSPSGLVTPSQNRSLR